MKHQPTVKTWLVFLMTTKDVVNTLSCRFTAIRSIRLAEGCLYPTLSACNSPCLILVQVAVLSDAAEIRVFRKGHIGHLFHDSNAHNTGAFNTSFVRHECGVENTHRPRVKNRPRRGLC